MIYKSAVVLLALASCAEAFHLGGTRGRHSVTPMQGTIMQNTDGSSMDNMFSSVSKGLAAAALVGSMTTSSLPVAAADYAPAAAPPVLTPQLVTKKSIKAGTPDKWIYSKFLDEVEKNDVEKV